LHQPILSRFHVTTKELHCLLPLLNLTFYFGLQPEALLSFTIMPALSLLYVIMPFIRP